MRNKSVVSLAVAGALAVGVAGVAVGDPWSGSDRPAPVAVADDAPVAPPPGPANAGAAHQTSSTALRTHLERGGPEYLEGSDWASARSFAIPGTNLRGWTFDQRSGKRCLAIPDPLAEGYGISCDTPKEIAAGESTVVMLPPVGSGAPNIVAALTAGNAAASIEAPQGDAKYWERIGDVYAGVAPAGSRLVVAGRSQAIAPAPGEVVEAAPAP